LAGELNVTARIAMQKSSPNFLAVIIPSSSDSVFAAPR